MPENSLFGSTNSPDSVESKDQDCRVTSKVQTAQEQSTLGNSLFDDNDDDEDFFSGKTLKKPTSGESLKSCLRTDTCQKIVNAVVKNNVWCLAAQEKAKSKTTAGLFGGDEDDEDEDGDIFNVGHRSTISQQSKKTVEKEEVVQPSEKKVVKSYWLALPPGGFI